MHAAVAAGADLIEVGMPFSDVMADGPVIQQACASALEQGTGTDEVLAMVAEFRRRDQNTPVVFMGYANLIERRGAETFCRQAAEDRKSTRLNSSHVAISYAVFCLKKKIILIRYKSTCKKSISFINR